MGQDGVSGRMHGGAANQGYVRDNMTAKARRYGEIFKILVKYADTPT
jgi:hypothetical protein